MMLDKWAGLTAKALTARILLLTAAIEALCLFFRFVLGLQSQQHTTWLAPVTLGFRLHHGFIGLALLIITPCLRKYPGLQKFLFAFAMALVLSDAIHHFLILWPLTGSHDFYLRYDMPS